MKNQADAEGRRGRVLKDSKLEVKVLYFVVFILIGVLLTLIFGMTFTLPEFKISSSLATFLGALLGAGISGGTAIYVMNRDIYSRKEERRKESNDNFIKSFELISMWSDS